MRRLTDVAVAILLGVVLAPLVVAAALVVLITLGRPVLFRQVRCGRGGRPFWLWKFRTMRPEAFPGQSDADRTPRAGALLRAASLDELPQLWNILRGQMSLIGPRPTLCEQVIHYSERQRGRLAVRPGLTGWAQVNGRNEIGWPERIELDLWYIGNRSPGLDLKILFRTASTVIRRRGVIGADGMNPGFPTPSADDEIAVTLPMSRIGAAAVEVDK